VNILNSAICSELQAVPAKPERLSFFRKKVRSTPGAGIKQRRCSSQGGVLPPHWPQAFIEEGSLTVNILLLRKILTDSPEKAKYIETIPRVGYRSAVEVKARTLCSNARNSILW
jgi:Transcriptional regulatory protein, C terminal